MNGHTGPVEAVGFSPTGGSVVSLGENGKVLGWECETFGAIPDAFRPEPGGAVSLSPDGGRRGVGDGGGTIRLFATQLDAWEEGRRQWQARFDPLWHVNRADAAGEGGNPFAEAFHLRLLVKHAPSDAELRRRLATAEAKLRSAPGSP